MQAKAPSERHRRLPRAGPVRQRPRSPRPGEGEPAMTEAPLSGEPDGCQEHLTATETVASAIEALHEAISGAGPLERIELWRRLRERIDEGLDELTHTVPQGGLQSRRPSRLLFFVQPRCRRRAFSAREIPMA